MHGIDSTNTNSERSWIEGAKEIFPSQKTRDLELAGTQCRKHIYDDAGVGLFVDDL